MELATTIDWVILVGIVFILILLIVFMMEARKAALKAQDAENNLRRVEASVISTAKQLDIAATNVNSFITMIKTEFQQAEPSVISAVGKLETTADSVNNFVTMAKKELQQAEPMIINAAGKLETVADNVNKFLTKAEPVFDYAENFICNNITPKPSFCPPSLAPINPPSTPIPPTTVRPLVR